MATTTNYGWTTPDDTALVKDGASAIRTLGSSVDTTTKNLNPETTLGDIAYRSSTANVNTRLGLGTAGQVLTVNSGANAPEWATPASGGMTLLSTTTLSGASTTISSINQTYNNLYILITGVTNATSDNNFYCRPNSATTTTWGAVDTAIRTGGTDWVLTGDTTHPDRTSSNNAYALTIFNYASSTAYKPIAWSAFFTIAGGSPNQRIYGGGGFRSNTAVSSILFASSGGNLSTGTVLIYGVK